MKTIFDWFKRNLYVVLFLVLEVFSIGLYLRYHQQEEARFLDFCTGVRGRFASVFGDRKSRESLLNRERGLWDAGVREAFKIRFESLFRSSGEAGAGSECFPAQACRSFGRRRGSGQPVEEEKKHRLMMDAKKHDRHGEKICRCAVRLRGL